MAIRSLLVSGSSGLVGSEVASFFDFEGAEVHGIDNNQRKVFLGPKADTRWNQQRLSKSLRSFVHHEVDIRDRQAVLDLIKEIRPDAIVHAAGQPSHDRAAAIPFADFDTNAVGTLNLLEATRQFCPEAAFVYLSTNKVYGDAPNEIPVDEHKTRWDYKASKDWNGVSESLRIDASMHSLFGASKLAADIMVQEYGRYFGMHTCCLRAGCLTGPTHSGVELHGFLSHLVNCNLSGAPYTVYGYKGKQVRDNMHALDIARFIAQFVARPRQGEAYNIGGGRDNSCSILEAFIRIEEITGRPMNWTYEEQHRKGDHRCYISDMTKLKSHYPDFHVTISLDSIFSDLARGWENR